MRMTCGRCPPIDITKAVVIGVAKALKMVGIKVPEGDTGCK